MYTAHGEQPGEIQGIRQDMKTNIGNGGKGYVKPISKLINYHPDPQSRKAIQLPLQNR
jgi:hypothetical protein